MTPATGAVVGAGAVAAAWLAFGRNKGTEQQASEAIPAGEPTNDGSNYGSGSYANEYMSAEAPDDFDMTSYIDEMKQRGVAYSDMLQEIGRKVDLLNCSISSMRISEAVRKYEIYGREFANLLIGLAQREWSNDRFLQTGSAKDAWGALGFLKDNDLTIEDAVQWSITLKAHMDALEKYIEGNGVALPKLPSATIVLATNLCGGRLAGKEGAVIAGGSEGLIVLPSDVATVEDLDDGSKRLSLKQGVSYTLKRTVADSDKNELYDFIGASAGDVVTMFAATPAYSINVKMPDGTTFNATQFAFIDSIASPKTETSSNVPIPSVSQQPAWLETFGHEFGTASSEIADALSAKKNTILSAQPVAAFTAPPASSLRPAVPSAVSESVNAGAVNRYLNRVSAVAMCQALAYAAKEDYAASPADTALIASVRSAGMKIREMLSHPQFRGGAGAKAY